MKLITIDCSDIDSREALHRAFSEALSFPDWYGNNLDALHDCLTDIHEDTTVVLQNWEAAQTQLAAFARTARRAMEHASKVNSHLNIEFL